MTNAKRLPPPSLEVPAAQAPKVVKTTARVIIHWAHGCTKGSTKHQAHHSHRHREEYPGWFAPSLKVDQRACGVVQGHWEAWRMPFFAHTNKFKHKISQCAETWDSYGQFIWCCHFHFQWPWWWNWWIPLPGCIDLVGTGGPAWRWEHICAVYAVSIDVSLIGMNMYQKRIELFFMFTLFNACCWNKTHILLVCGFNPSEKY